MAHHHALPITSGRQTCVHFLYLRRCRSHRFSIAELLPLLRSGTTSSFRLVEDGKQVAPPIHATAGAGENNRRTFSLSHHRSIATRRLRRDSPSHHLRSETKSSHRNRAAPPKKKKSTSSAIPPHPRVEGETEPPNLPKADVSTSHPTTPRPRPRPRPESPSLISQLARIS
jgi:hypothetical protein